MKVSKEIKQKLKLLEEFLKENDLELFGCGCCGSPSFSHNGEIVECVVFRDSSLNLDDKDVRLRIGHDEISVRKLKTSDT